MLGMSDTKKTPGNICGQAGRESRGIVSPFSPASVCKHVCIALYVTC